MAKERVRKEVSQYAQETTGSSIVDRNIGIPEFLHLVRFSTLKQLKTKRDAVRQQASV